MKRALLVLLVFGVVTAGLAAQSVGDRQVVVASKKFTESVILGELVTQVLRAEGAEVRHRRELGGSRVLFSGLLRGDIDAYPEYTGTLMGELLVDEKLRTLDELRASLETRGIRMSDPIGFNNTYAVGVTRETAEELDLETVSDLADHPEIRMGFSNEFMERADGWPGLRDAYGLQNPARGMDHDLAYRGLQSGDIGAMDLYATDAEIEYYDLVVLEDDLGYFPRYDAVVLWRADLEDRLPSAGGAIGLLEGAIDETAMAAMNRLAKIGPTNQTARTVPVSPRRSSRRSFSKASSTSRQKHSSKPVARCSFAPRSTTSNWSRGPWPGRSSSPSRSASSRPNRRNSRSPSSGASASSRPCPRWPCWCC